MVGTLLFSILNEAKRVPLKAPEVGNDVEFDLEDFESPLFLTARGTATAITMTIKTTKATKSHNLLLRWDLGRRGDLCVS